MDKNYNVAVVGASMAGKSKWILKTESEKKYELK